MAQKLVTVTLTLRVDDDQPVQDWLIEAINQYLRPQNGEEIVYYSDTEPEELMTMQSYIVLYRREDIMAPTDPPFTFQCYADDPEHSKEQCLNADPDANIVLVVDTVDVAEAYAAYWTTSATFLNSKV